MLYRFRINTMHTLLKNLFLVALLLLVQLTVHAQDVVIDSIRYTVNYNETVTLYGTVSKTRESIVVPDSVEYYGDLYPVTTIGSFGFYNCKRLKQVVLPANLLSIEENAFKNCSSLDSVIIPSKVRSLGSGIFFGCTSLTYVGIVGNNRIAGFKFPSVFEGCTTVTHIDIKEGRSYYSVDGVVYRRNKLIYCGNGRTGEVMITDSTTEIAANAFAGCSKLTKIQIPPSVTIIGQNGFSNCTGISSMELPKGLSNLAPYTFSGCTNLASIQLPDSLINIGENAFKDCSNLTSIQLPEALQTLERYGFSGCENLSNITFPQAMKTIEAEVFKDCSGLTALHLPETLETIGDSAFMDMKASIQFPTYVGHIGMRAFQNCLGISALMFNNDVNKISGGAFWGCTNLTSIDFTNAAVQITQGAFKGCNSLSSIHVRQDNMSLTFEDGILYNKDRSRVILCLPNKQGEVKLPNSVKIIDNMAFYGCTKITSVNIPCLTTSVGTLAFEKCSALKDIYMEQNTATEYNFLNYGRLPKFTLHVPPNTMEYYQSYESYWRKEEYTLVKLKPETITVPTTFNTISFDDDFIYLSWADGTVDTILSATVGKVLFDIQSMIGDAGKVDQDYSIYPNPTAEFITIKSDINAPNADLTIYNMNGQMVLSKKNVQLNQPVDISELSTGIYFVKINGSIFKLNKQ